jgi:hypothetical protein
VRRFGRPRSRSSRPCTRQAQTSAARSAFVCHSASLRRAIAAASSSSPRVCVREAEHRENQTAQRVLRHAVEQREGALESLLTLG